MNTLQQKHLIKLRNVESTNEWNDCLESAKTLLAYVTYDAIVTILVNRILYFLSSVLNLSSEGQKNFDKFPGLKETTSLTELGRHAQDIYLALADKSNQPGINNFRNSLKRLIELITNASSSEMDIDALTGIFAGILMAILLHEWGKKNPDLWIRSFQQKSRGDAFILAKYFWSVPETLALNKKLWHDIADELETALNT